VITYEIALVAGVVAFVVGYAIGRAHLHPNSGVLAVAIALIILIAAAIATMRWTGEGDLAGQLAIVAYYFLITGVILNIIRFIREGSRQK